MFFSKIKTGSLPFRISKIAPHVAPRVAPNPPPPQTAPICHLPIELIQEISTYLEPAAAASFCLSARYIYYAVGTAHLSNYLQSTGTKYTKGTKIQRRKNIEILERAFPSHWFCAWCDKFHAQDQDSGPKNSAREVRRDCTKFNSYLHAKSEYVVRYHHVRLAVNHGIWGPGYGIPLDTFRYSKMGIAKVLNQEVLTKCSSEAKIRDGRLILHAKFEISLPVNIMKNPGWLDALWPILPQIVVGHRDSHNGHTGLKMTLKSNGFVNHVQLCSLCATDYLVHRENFRTRDGQQQVMFLIEAHRDLGDGRSPFDASWRAHGELGDGVPGFGADLVRLTGFQAGDFKKVFEAEGQVKQDLTGGDAVAGLDEFHRRHERTELLLSGNLSVTQEIFQARAAEVEEQTVHLRLDPPRDSGGRTKDNMRQWDLDAVSTLRGRTHAQRVAHNNARIKAEGPRFTPPYGMSWSDFVDLGGLRGSDGIPLTDAERSQLTSGRGFYGG